MAFMPSWTLWRGTTINDGPQQLHCHRTQRCFNRKDARPRRTENDQLEAGRGPLTGDGLPRKAATKPATCSSLLAFSRNRVQSVRTTPTPTGAIRGSRPLVAKGFVRPTVGTARRAGRPPVGTANRAGSPPVTPARGARW